MSAKLLRSRSLLFGILFLAIGSTSYAQRVTATIGVGNIPLAVAVNPVTNRVYVANQSDNSVTMIDATNGSRTTIPVGTQPRAVAVNPMTNKIYVANGGSANVTVINGADNTTAPVGVGATPAAIAVNPVTNKIYVANLTGNTVTVINGADNSTAPPVSTGTAPRSVAVNTVTNKVYVTNQSSSLVYVINGADNSVTSVNVGANSFAVAVNPITNKVYVTNSGSGNVTVIDASNNNNVTPLSVGTGPTDVAVNPVTNMAYVSNNGSGTVTVIDGSNNIIATVNTSTNPMGIGVNPVNNKIYVANPSGNKITVIDGATNTPTQLNAGNNPVAVAVNSVTNRAYVINSASNNVTVVDGATNTTAPIGTDAAPIGIGVNPATNKIYVANYTGNDVTVIDGVTSAAMNVPDPNGPISIGVNPVTNKIYVGNQNSTVTVLDGATNATSLVNVTAPGAININPLTNRIYVLSDFGIITVLDGNTNTVVGTVNGGNEPVGSDINPVTNKIYVANCPCDVAPPPSNTVTIIDGATNAVNGTVAVPQPRSIAVNSVTNKIYVANSNNTVTVIDGFTTIAFNLPGGPSPGPIAVNPISNRIYVGNNASGNGQVAVIDGGTNFVFGGIPVGGIPQAIAVNPVTNKIYVASSNNTVAVIDGSSNAVSTLSTDTGPLALAVNAITNKIYVANNGSGDVTAMTEQQVSAIPLTTAITPFTNNLISIPNPTVFFNTNSTYSPNAPAVQNVFFQMDTWQGQWLPGTSSGPSSFRGNSPVLRPGTHVLYAYAGDGQTADSSLTGAQSSPIPGQIAAYFFAFVPSAATPTVVLTSSANPSFFNQTVTFTAMVSGTLGSPTNMVSFYDNYPTGPLLTTVRVNSGTVTFTTSTLSPGTHPITAVYSGDAIYTPAISNAVYQFVTHDPTVTTVTLTAGTNPAAAGASLTFTATVTSQYPGVPSGNVGAVVFRDGNGAIGPGTPAGPGAWTFTTSALAPGVHAIIAVYGGDPTFTGSTSAAFNQIIESNAGGASTAALTVNGGTGVVKTNFGVVQGVPPGKANFQVTVTGGSNGDQVVLLDGNRQLGPTLSLSGGLASYLTQLPVGQHNVQAVYVGNGGTAGSSSTVVIVERSPRPRPR